MSKRYPGGVIRKTPATPTQASASGVWNMTDVTQAQQTNNWPVANVPNPMSRSLRFRASASAYMNRTPATATNRKTWTWSAWVKRGTSTFNTLFAAYQPAPRQYIAFYNNQLYAYGTSSGTDFVECYTSAVFRDFAAWYHIVFVYDTTQATGSNRVKIYVNGVQQTLTFTTTPSQNSDGAINGAWGHFIGAQATPYPDMDAYLSEVNFIDGQALAATSFGQYDQFGNWTSKQYTGTYGTNGFYLPFKNNSSTGTLGLDFSGNNNTWTTNNFSVTPSYQYTTYTSGSGTYTVPSNVTSIQYLVVAGGGGGGNRAGGGGGAGGLVQGTMAVTPGQTIAYSVGTGGAGGAASGGTNNNGTNGTNSTFGSLTAVGGGAGATPGDGIAGGSGGGAGHGGGPGGAGTLGQGSTGGTGANAFNGAGGGGGAGAVGGDRSGNSGGAGGAGLTWINGTTYAGGGGGGGRADIGGSPGAGGSGGGGAAGSPGANGTANTGGGGGGGMYTGTGQAGGTGGSGVVIVAYATGNSTYDSMTDVPTQWTPYNVTGDVGGIIRGNYAVLNPLGGPSGGLQGTLSNGNLTWQSPTSDQKSVLGTIAVNAVSTGKWYWEVYPTSKTSTYWAIGAFPYNLNQYSATSASAQYRSDGAIFVNTSNVTTVASYTAGDVIGLAFDASTNQLSWYKNNTLQTTQTVSNSAGFLMYPGLGSDSSGGYNIQSINFGQYAFTYAPPSGYKSLCTTNLPTPTIQQGNLVMDAITYTGQSGTKTITTTGGFSPDLVWIKNRSQARWHSLFDQLRGAYKRIFTNSTSAETNDVGYNLNSFTSSGFTLLDTDRDTNSSAGDAYVAWCWNAGSGSSSSNTSGSITSTVSVNATAGFSVVTWTGAGSTGTVGHGLGVAPSMIIAKRRNTTTNWQVYHSSLGATNQVCLNLTNASFSTTTWNNTTPTSSVFSVDNVELGANGGTYVAYCWSEIAGFSKFGSFTGNGSADGPFIYLGFRPRFFMYKKSSSTSQWWMFDSSRNTYNVVNNVLFADASSAEGTNDTFFDFDSNGVKMRDRTDVNTNGSGSTYIYMAFAEYPFKSALAR
jgi:hypothetical protein